MRVGDASFYLRFLVGLDHHRERTDRALQSLADGKRVRAASDDPAGAHESLALRARLARLGGYDSSAESARMDLATLDRVLGEAVNTLTEVRVEAMAAASTPTAEANQARAEVVEQFRTQMIALANTSQRGRHLFGGTETLTPPFAADGSYSGNNDEVRAPVNTNESIGANLSGQRVFLDGVDIFALLDDMAQAMRDNRTDDIGAMVASMGDAVAHIGTVQADIGSRMQRIDHVLASHGDEALGLLQRVGEIEDVDLAEVIVDLQQSETATSALSAAATRMLGRSLFDYLG